LRQNGIPYRRDPRLIQRVATLIADGKAVGWFQGRMEFGPRALGNRSILADPRRPQMRENLNRRIKERARFRPFAPSVLEHEARTWFETHIADDDQCHHPQEYMLLALPANAEAVQSIPAVIHKNHETGVATARVNVVKHGRNPLYEELLTEYRCAAGTSVVLNTSFNSSEPIVCRPDEACKTFLRSGLDALAMGPFLVERN
jgi:carbamoyltransferase